MRSRRIFANASENGGRTPVLARTVFLDLNGTIVMPVIVERLDDLRPVSGAVEAIARLCAHGFRCPVVTIQSRIEKGLFTQAEFLDWFRGFATSIKPSGAFLDGPYVCPHRFTTPCVCKKPGTALYERAAAELGLELPGAYVIGDTAADMEAAQRLGGIGCMVRTGFGQDDGEVARASPFTSFVGAALPDAVDWILTRPV